MLYGVYCLGWNGDCYTSRGRCRIRLPGFSGVGAIVASFVPMEGPEGKGTLGIFGKPLERACRRCMGWVGGGFATIFFRKLAVTVDDLVVQPNLNDGSTSACNSSSATVTCGGAFGYICPNFHEHKNGLHSTKTHNHAHTQAKFLHCVCTACTLQ